MLARAALLAGLTAAAVQATPAFAQSTDLQLQATEQAASDAFDVDAIGEFAAANRLDDATFAEAPAVGGTVGDDVRLSPVTGHDGYSYTYYKGKPVIVRDTDRTVVSLGD